MSIGTDHGHRGRPAVSGTRRRLSLKAEVLAVFDDLGTVLLGGMVLAGVVIIACTFDGDLQGKDEIVAAVLGTLSLFAILAALELADRLRAKRRG